jgi:hypothetical protein
MNMIEVESSNIESVGYENNQLFVKFKSGGLYAYKNVPSALYQQFLTAESKGKYFFSHIKGKFDFEKSS